jgi:hypothetical protein
VRRVILAHGRVVEAPDASPMLSDVITTGAPEVSVAPVHAGAARDPLVLPDIRLD